MEGNNLELREGGAQAGKGKKGLERCREPMERQSHPPIPTSQVSGVCHVRWDTVYRAVQPTAPLAVPARHSETVEGRTFTGWR